jgi:peroxiredoxin/outer membrane lipoprotein-sorting protein
MQKGKLGTVCGLIVLLAISMGFGSSDDQATELLKRVSETYKNLKSYHFEGKEVVEGKAQGAEMKAETPVLIAAIKPDRLRTERKDLNLGMMMMMGSVVVSNGEMTWRYMPRANQYTKKALSLLKQDSDTGNASPSGSSTANPVAKYEAIANKLKSAKLLREEAVEIQGGRVDCYVVEAEYEPLPGREERPKTFWIDKTRNIVLREVSIPPVRFGGSGSSWELRSTTAYTVAKINEPIAETLFAFVPPDGAKEVDDFDLPGMRKSTLTGKEAGEFTLKDFAGNEVSLKDLRGKVVVLSFWATWCKPCIEEMPILEKLHRDFKDKGLVVLGINNEQPDTAREFLAKTGYTYPTLADTGREVHRQYQVEGIPQVVVIDKEGKVTAHFVGFSPESSETKLREAIKKAGIA